MKEKMLMNPFTGTVQSVDDWLIDFVNTSEELWGSETFESANLIEVERINGEWIEVG